MLVDINRIHFRDKLPTSAYRTSTAAYTSRRTPERPLEMDVPSSMPNIPVLHGKCFNVVNVHCLMSVFTQCFPTPKKIVVQLNVLTALYVINVKRVSLYLI